MSTICSFCGSEINEDSEQNKEKKYLYCKCGHGMVPKGAKSGLSKSKLKSIEIKLNLKGGKKMVGENEVVKKERPKSVIVKELLKEGKTIEEISKITGIKVSYVSVVVKEYQKKQTK